VVKHGSTHWFLCETAQVLPRWREAFPRVVAASLDAPAPAGEPAEAVLWIRLKQGTPVADQLGTLAPGWRAWPLVVLSDLPDDEEALAAFSAGARGYCNTHSAPQVLRQVASVVLQGGLWIGPSLMRRLLAATSRLPPAATPPATAWDQGLTGREREVARLVASGASNKEVARALGISERTVKAHAGAVFAKLGVRDRLQLSLVVNGRAPRK
jgi:DNA-binding NarL/FixJ family response regulator